MGKQNQRGITLIELLITLSILSFIGTLVWGVFLQGSKYSHRAMTKNQMQQEANIIITKLTRIHQKSDSYVLNYSDCKISITYKQKKSEQTETFENDNLCYYIDKSAKDENNFVPITVTNPKILKDVWIRVEEKKNPSNKTKVEAYFFRLK